jgi:hypothetical protein
MQLRNIGEWRYSSTIIDPGTDGDEWSASRLGRHSTREKPGTYWIGGWVGPKAGLEAEMFHKIFCDCKKVHFEVSYTC